MDLDVAQTLREALENEGEDVELREDYSGRCMYGKKTAGIVCDSFALLVTAIISNAELFVDVDMDEAYNKFETGNFRTDSMATQIIIY